MGVFGDYAMKYWEAGYSVIPVNGKTASIEGFQRFSLDQPNIEEIEAWEKSLDNSNIGLVLGLNDLICIDIDYDGEYRNEFIESIISVVLPKEAYATKTFIAKKGQKGLSFFCRGKIPGKKIKNPKNKDIKEPVVEILSKGNYTVLPPSIHPDLNRPYLWTTNETLLDVKCSDLIEISQTDINNICSVVNYFFENFSQRKKPGRNNSLGAFVFREAKSCKSINELTDLVIKYDEFINSKNPYFRDLKESHGESPKIFANKFVTRAVEWLKKDKAKKGIIWELGFDESEDGYDIYKQFFQRTLGDVRKCKLTDIVYIYQSKDKVRPLENEVKTIQSYAISSKIDHSKVDIHLSRWMKEIEPTLLTDLEPWDGVSRIKNLLSFITPIGLSKEHFQEIMMEWIANIFKRVENKNYQNFCPIWCGGQGIGKDTFIENLFSGLGRYFANISINENEEKNFQNIYGKIICNIAEFDKASKAHPAVMKNLISSGVQTLRFPYDRRAIDAVFRASFIGSSNTDEVLFDSTGARRFAVIKLEEIDFSYPKDIGMELLAEMIHLAEVGYQASDEAWAIVDETLEQLTPDTEDGLKEAIIGHWNRKASEALQIVNASKNTNHDFLSQEVAYEIILDISAKFKFSQFRVRNILKMSGFQKRVKLDGRTIRIWYPNQVSNSGDSVLVSVTDFIKRVNVLNHL